MLVAGSLALGLLAACNTPQDTADAALDATCEAPALAPRQLRLLTRREYRRSVQDLLDLSFGGDDPDCGSWTFSLDDAGYSSVSVAGSFNGWDADAWHLGYDDGAWRGDFDVGAGDHQYKFVIDGWDWIADPSNPDGADDGYGGWNSAISVSCDAGLDDPTADFPVESRPAGFPFDNSAPAGLVTSNHADRYLEAAFTLSQAAMADPEGLLVCDLYAEGDCEAALLDELGTRIFRRPLSDDERSRYAALIDGGEDTADGLELALAAMLASPRFLYRSELGTWQPDGTWRLTPWEIAAALSYTFWGTTPDSELLDAAADNSLYTAEGLETQARRLLDDPRSREQLATFSVQWLGVDAVDTMDRSATTYPDFDPALLDDMLAEAGDFVGHVVFENEGSFLDLLTAGYSLPSAELAAHYGLDHYGDGEPVPTWDRAGVLGLGAVLVAGAHSDQSSPIRRGLFVREALLCQDLGEPPPEAAVAPAVDPDATTRERFAQHTEDPSCASCHSFIDPVGFGFEQFDATGALRSHDNGQPVDHSGELVDVEWLGAGTRDAFSTLPELAGLLADSEAAPACFARQVYRYTTGQHETAAEDCAAQALAADFAAAGFDVRELMIAAVTSHDFILRGDAE